MAEEQAVVDETVDEADNTDATASDDAGAESAEEQDWKAHSRKHEREAKKARKEAEELRAKLAEREQADMSEHERAIAAAREEGKAEATTAVQQRLLKAEIRAAAAGKFANPNLALKLLEIDESSAFDDEGEVVRAPIEAAITALLEENPGLAAVPKGPGDNDAGKGRAAKDLEDMSVEEHFNRRQGAN
jgi:flagellar biosynthesis GTPase FlhF